MDKKDAIAYIVFCVLIALWIGTILGAILCSNDWHSALTDCENRHQENSYCCANAQFLEGRVKSVEAMLDWCYGELASEQR